jgi:hypothetical protein
MPDITMCKNHACPIKQYCYRACAAPSERQSWTTFWPECIPTGRVKHCEGFVPFQQVLAILHGKPDHDLPPITSIYES